ncbi:hypothetical protein ACFX12_046908 [Malus domestica]
MVFLVNTLRSGCGCGQSSSHGSPNTQSLLAIWDLLQAASKPSSFLVMCVSSLTSLFTNNDSSSSCTEVHNHHHMQLKLISRVLVDSLNRCCFRTTS